MADNVDLINKMYSKLTKALTLDSNALVPGHSYLVLANPGIFLHPGWDMSDPEAQRQWAMLLNRAPAPGPLFQPATFDVDQMYHGIRANKELPLFSLTEQQKAQLDEAKALLRDPDGEPTKTWVNYLKFKSEYDSAAIAWQSALQDQTNGGKLAPTQLRVAMNNAKKNWDVLGDRKRVENAIATINNLQGLDPNGWWAELDEIYENNVLSSGANSFPITGTYPAYESFFGDRGWTKFTFNQQDFQKQTKLTSTSAGGGVGVAYGLWLASGGADYSKTTSYSKSSTTDISISVELMRVVIDRPWFDPLVLRSRAWRWGINNLGAISDGADPSTGATPHGDMPLLPTDLVLARNLEISGQFSSEEQRMVRTMLEVQASVGYGPFSIKGHYGRSSSEESSHATMTGTTITNPDVQVIGWFCEVLPMVPNPDPALPWPTALTAEHYPQTSPDPLVSGRHPLAVPGTQRIPAAEPPPPALKQRESAPAEPVRRDNGALAAADSNGGRVGVPVRRR